MSSDIVKMPTFEVKANWREDLRKRAVQPFDDAKKAVFIRTLAQTGKRVLALHAANVDHHTVFRHERSDSEFKEAMEMAKDFFKARTVAKIEQDAIEGHLEQYFDKDSGAITRERRVFETKLREMILRAKAEEEYADKKHVDIGVAPTAMGIIPGVVSMEMWDAMKDELDRSIEEMVLDEGTEDSSTEDP